MRILDHYYNEDGEVKNKTARWVRVEFIRPRFSASSLRRILASEEKIRTGTKKSKLNREDAPQWPELEVSMIHVETVPCKHANMSCTSDCVCVCIMRRKIFQYGSEKTAALVFQYTNG